MSKQSDSEEEEKTLIQIDTDLRDDLKDKKKQGDSYNDVIRRMKDNYEKYLRVKNFVLEDIAEENITK